MTPQLDHEKLRVYQEALRFVRWVDEAIEKVPKGLAARKHLDEASTSIPLNIAEGNGKFRPADRCRFLDIGPGSALECAACLDVLVARRHMTAETATEGKGFLQPIVSMLVGLIKAVSPSRVAEEIGGYGEE